MIISEPELGLWFLDTPEDMQERLDLALVDAFAGGTSVYQIMPDGAIRHIDPTDYWL